MAPVVAIRDRGMGLYSAASADRHREIDSGGQQNTTNNQMELLAVIRGLEALKRSCSVELFTDSVYVGKACRSGCPRGRKTAATS